MSYVHMVFFTFKSEVSDIDIKAQIEDGQQLLGRIETVRRLETGLRDEAMQREVSVTDFQVGLTVIFDDKAGYQVYADHPQHTEYVNRNKGKWEKIAVYDYMTD
jgi:hypothetical protein